MEVDETMEGTDAVRLTTGWGTDSWIVLCVWGNKMKDKKKEKVEDIEEMRERVKEFKQMLEEIGVRLQ